MRTRQSGLYDGNLSVHDNEGKPAASLQASHTTVNEGGAITLSVILGHRIDRAVTMPLKVHQSETNRPGGRFPRRSPCPRTSCRAR